jgi:cell division protein FtsB
MYNQLEKLKIENEQLTQHVAKLNKIATINMVIDAIILVCLGIAYLI